MCLNIEVILPTVRRCLLLYPLRTGCLLIFIWTLLRSIFCVVFFSTAILEAFTPNRFPAGPFLLKQQAPGEQIYITFYSCVVLLINEFVLLVFLLHLAAGICHENPYLLKHYLICRAVTWFVEITFLPILCFLHKALIGWYLGILMFVVLEFYAFVVVYSFYAYVMEDTCDDK